MEAYRYGRHGKRISTVYRGFAPVTGRPIAGKLTLGARANTDSARIALLSREHTAIELRAACEAPCTVGLVFVGEELPFSLLQAAREHTLPLLLLESLPQSHVGAVAILDSERESLLIHPDVDALSLYAHEEAKALAPRISTLYAARTLTRAEPAFSGDLLCIPNASRAKDTPEEELFFELCEAVEAARPHTLYLSLPAYADELLYVQMRAVLRASVLGKLVMLWEDVLSGQDWNARLSIRKAAAADLAREGYEHNAAPSDGLAVTSPLSLFVLGQFPTPTHVCLSLPSLLPALMGRNVGRFEAAACRDATLSMLSASTASLRAPLSVHLPTPAPFSDDELCRAGVAIGFEKIMP